jgi:hypothetical protein
MKALNGLVLRGKRGTRLRLTYTSGPKALRVFVSDDSEITL